MHIYLLGLTVPRGEIENRRLLNMKTQLCVRWLKLLAAILATKTPAVQVQKCDAVDNNLSEKSPT